MRKCSLTRSRRCKASVSGRMDRGRLSHTLEHLPSDLERVRHVGSDYGEAGCSVAVHIQYAQSGRQGLGGRTAMVSDVNARVQGYARLGLGEGWRRAGVNGLITAGDRGGQTGGGRVLKWSGLIAHWPTFGSQLQLVSSRCIACVNDWVGLASTDAWGACLILIDESERAKRGVTLAVTTTEALSCDLRHSLQGSLQHNIKPAAQSPAWRRHAESKLARPPLLMGC